MLPPRKPPVAPTFANRATPRLDAMRAKMVERKAARLANPRAAMMGAKQGFASQMGMRGTPPAMNPARPGPGGFTPPVAPGVMPTPRRASGIGNDIPPQAGPGGAKMGRMMSNGGCAKPTKRKK